jgi:membrane protease YdiL (CAAX protease family)
MPALTFDTPTYLPFLFLMMSVIGLWVHRWMWVGGLLAAVISAYLTGVMYGYAFLWIALLAATAVHYRMRVTHPGSGLPLPHWAYPLMFAIVALWLGLAPPTGFPRTPFIDSVRLSPDAIVWSIGLGFNKVVTGIFILGILHQENVRSWRELGSVLIRVMPVLLVTTAAVMLIAIALGNVRFDPKWSPLFPVWAPVNLLFTCMAEEAFFRGFAQREVNALFSNRRFAAIISIAVGAVMFGLVHYRGGWTYTLMQTLAGAGFGWAYHRTKRIEAAMAVHFGFDSLQFLLFTFPALE